MPHSCIQPSSKPSMFNIMSPFTFSLLPCQSRIIPWELYLSLPESVQIHTTKHTTLNFNTTATTFPLQSRVNTCSSTEAEIFTTDRCVKSLQRISFLAKGWNLKETIMLSLTMIYNDNSTCVQ